MKWLKLKEILILVLIWIWPWLFILWCVSKPKFNCTSKK